MRQLAKYSFVNAKIRAMLSMLLPQQFFSRLIESYDLSSAIDILQETNYKDSVKVMQSSLPDNLGLPALEKNILKSDIEIYKKVYKMLLTKREREFVFILTQRFEIEQLKNILRIWYNHRNVDFRDYIYQDKICYLIDYKKILSAEKIGDIILALGKTPYDKALFTSQEIFTKKNNLFYLEAALDLDYYKRLRECLEGFSSSDKKITKKILGVEIDIENINWLVRMRRFYALDITDVLKWTIPGGVFIKGEKIYGLDTSEGLAKIIEGFSFGPYTKIKNFVEENVNMIEIILSQILYQEVKKILGGYPFTIGTVLGYLLLKRRESKNIIAVLYGKKCKWPNDKIKAVLI